LGFGLLFIVLITGGIFIKIAWVFYFVTLLIFLLLFWRLFTSKKSRSIE